MPLYACDSIYLFIKIKDLFSKRELDKICNYFFVIKSSIYCSTFNTTVIPFLTK